MSVEYTPRHTGAARIALAALLAVGLSGLAVTAASADDRIEKRLWVVAKPRNTVVVDSFRELREDCVQAPAPKVVVSQQPKLGKMVVKAVVAPGSTDAAGPYAACNGKKFNWTRVTWPAPAKGEGTDRAVIEATESSGETTVYDVEIVYAKTLPSGKSNGLYEDR
jgi:hypothetical protein